MNISSKDFNSPWRLIPFLNAPGDIQMAIDAFVLQQHQLGQHPPTLRFYTFSSVTLSLGRLQRRYPQQWQKLRWQETVIDLVRRPSGGRAVLHQGDLTYMVVTSQMPKKVSLAYQQICQFLIKGFHSLGIQLHFGQVSQDYTRSANCFSTATNADLVDERGVKFIGSAQLHQKNAILQHGSIMLQPERQLFEQIFDIAPPQPVKLPFSEDWEAQIFALMDTLIQSASQCFGCCFEIQPLTSSEWQAIHELAPTFRL